MPTNSAVMRIPALQRDRSSGPIAVSFPPNMALPLNRCSGYNTAMLACVESEHLKLQIVEGKLTLGPGSFGIKTCKESCMKKVG